MTAFTWNNSGGGAWSNGISWSSGHTPIAGDTADITNPFSGGAYTVEVPDAEAAALVNLGVVNAMLAVEGGLLTAGSIDFTAGTLDLNNQGEISGATIDDTANKTVIFNDGTLDNVTWRGTLGLFGITPSSLLTVTTGLQVFNNASGTIPGTIDITGPGAEMNFASSMTLNGNSSGNLVINIGTSSAQEQYLGVGSNDILTLGTAVSFNQIAAGSTVHLIDIPGGSGGTITNDGTMTLTSGTGSGALITASNFINNGTINDIGGGMPAAAGEDLELTPGNSFAVGATGLIKVSEYGLVHINGPNGSVDVSGTIQVSTNGTVDLDTASVAVSDNSGTGVVLISTGGTAEIDYDYKGTVRFMDPTGTLALGNEGGGYTGSVVGLSRINAGTLDVIDLLLTTGVTLQPSFTSTVGGTLFVLDNTTTIASINLIGNYVGQQFGTMSDGQSTPGTDIFLGCFTAGSRILTARGEVPVEDLREDDLAVTQSDAGAKFRPVRWIGVMRVDAGRHPRPLTVSPIRVLAGAFGDARPHRDLLLSPDHAVFVDDVLIPVQYLVNGVTIRHEPVAGAITYFHVELDAHDVLLANGLPVESYLETGGRTNFANGGVPMRLHPDFSTRTWETEGCAPLVVTGPIVDKVRARLAERLSLAEAA